MSLRFVEKRRSILFVILFALLMTSILAGSIAKNSVTGNSSKSPLSRPDSPAVARAIKPSTTFASSLQTSNALTGSGTVSTYTTSLLGHPVCDQRYSCPSGNYWDAGYMDQDLSSSPERYALSTSVLIAFPGSTTPPSSFVKSGNYLAAGMVVQSQVNAGGTTSQDIANFAMVYLPNTGSPSIIGEVWTLPDCCNGAPTNPPPTLLYGASWTCACVDTSSFTNLVTLNMTWNTATNKLDWYAAFGVTQYYLFSYFPDPSLAQQHLFHVGTANVDCILSGYPVPNGCKVKWFEFGVMANQLPNSGWNAFVGNPEYVDTSRNLFKVQTSTWTAPFQTFFDWEFVIGGFVPSWQLDACKNGGNWPVKFYVNMPLVFGQIVEHVNPNPPFSSPVGSPLWDSSCSTAGTPAATFLDSTTNPTGSTPADSSWQSPPSFPTTIAFTGDNAAPYVAGCWYSVESWNGNSWTTTQPSTSNGVFCGSGGYCCDGPTISVGTSGNCNYAGYRSCRVTALVEDYIGTVATATRYFSITLSPRDFNISPTSPSYYTIYPQAWWGSNGATVTAANGFTGTISLSSSSSAGLSTYVSPTSLTLTSTTTSASTNINFYANSGGLYNFFITGTYGTITHSTATSTVAVPDFALSTSPSSFTAFQGASTPVQLTVGSVQGYSGNVQLSIALPDSSWTTSGFPASLSFNSGSSTSATFNISPGSLTSPGLYTVTITGSTSLNPYYTWSHTTNLTVTVVGNNRLTNPGFETGDFTGWSQTGMNLRADARNVHSGRFAAAPIYNPSTWIYSAFTLQQNLPTPVAGAYVTSIQLWYLYGDCCDYALVLYTDGSSTQTSLPQVGGWTLKTLAFDASKQISGIRVVRPSGAYNIIDLDDFQLISTNRVLSNNPAGSDWTSAYGTWTVVNGYIDCSGVSPQIQSSATFPSDRTVSVRDVTITSGGSVWKVAYLYGKYVDFYDKLYTYIQTDGTIVLAMWQGSTNHGYVYYNSGLSPYNWHTFTMVISGNTAKVYVDGTLYITATDPIIGSLGASSIGLASWGPSESQFDSATIS